jgi:hypothetical protein
VILTLLFLVVVQETCKESSDLKMISMLFDFLNRNKGDEHNTHVFLVSNDSDFQLLTSRLKRYPKVKTHLMTRLLQDSFFYGLADIVLFYENTPTQPQKREVNLISGGPDVDGKPSNQSPLKKRKR